MARMAITYEEAGIYALLSQHRHHFQERFRLNHNLHRSEEDLMATLKEVEDKMTEVGTAVTAAMKVKDDAATALNEQIATLQAAAAVSASPTDLDGVITGLQAIEAQLTAAPATP